MASDFSDVDFPESTSILLKLVRKNAEQEVNSHDNIIQTKLLIGCDGFKSLVRSRSTLTYYQFELEQIGIVGTLKLESPFVKNSIAFQRFIGDHMVIALLPLDDQHSSFILSIPAKDMQSWIKLTDEEFVYRFNTELVREKRSNPLDRLSGQLGESFQRLFGQNLLQTNPISQYHARIPPIIQEVLPGSRAAFPLGFGTTVPRLIGSIKTDSSYITRAEQNRFNYANTVIMGDAAHRVHPLAGQGLNLGLGDVAELVVQLESSLAQGYELFGVGQDSAESLTNALTQFERARIAKLVPMMGAIQSLQTVMAWTPAPLLSLFNIIPFVKEQVVSFANSR